jgi:PAS domain S-box-containing protein
MSYQLKSRIAFSVTLLTFGLMTLVGWLALTYFEEKFKQAAFAHLEDLLDVESEEISEELELAGETLKTIGSILPPELLGDRAALQEFFEEQTTGRLIFDNGISLLSPDGRLLAVAPREEGLFKKDYTSRRYFQETLRTDQPYISSPFQSHQNRHHPILMMTEPLHDEHGVLLGVLCGSIDLHGDNFIGRIGREVVSDHGYFLLADQSNVLISHPSKANILLPVNQRLPGLSLALEHTDGYGHIHRREVFGQDVIGVFTQIKGIDWTLVTIVPAEKIFFPIIQARNYLIIALVLLAVLTALIIRGFTSRLTAPLVILTEKVRNQINSQKVFSPLPSREFKEFGELADSIHSLMVDVAEKRQSLNDQLSFLQNLIDTIPGPIFYKDQEYRYIGCNRAFEEYIGMTRDQLIGRSVFDLSPPNLAKVYHQADADLWAHGGQQTYEATVKYADDTMHDVIFYKKVFHDASGQPAGMIGTFLDITDRKQSEMAMQESEKRFRLLVENAADAFFLHDVNGHILDVNAQACKVLGYTRDELLAMSVSDVSVDFNDEALTELQSALIRTEQATVEDRHQRKDGSVFPVEVRLCRVEQEGSLTIALARDISERKRNDETLQQALADAHEARDQVDNILRSAADGLVVTDKRNRVTHINQIALEMIGVEVDDVVGKPFTRLFINPILREQARTFLSEANLDARQYDFKIDRVGKQFPQVIQASSSVLLTPQGKRSGVVTLLRDVTRMRELDRIKSEFISTAAHEMRTPMSVIMGYCDLLLNSDDYGEFDHQQQKEFLSEVYRKGEALTQIIDDLFDVSRIEAGLPLPLDFAPCDLSVVIKEVVQHYQTHSSQHQFKMELTGPSGLVADCNKIHQVFDNLISNAVKYSPGGGVIRVCVTPEEGSLNVLIEDQGIGMTDEQLERIFDKFYRADSTDTAVGGLGMGMSIVKAIVDGHGGELQIESTLGQGTYVTMTLPLKPESDELSR